MEGILETGTAARVGGATSKRQGVRVEVGGKCFLASRWPGPLR